MSVPIVGSTDSPEQSLLVLEAGRADKHYWMDLWHYRELFFILAWRDLSVRYKQTVIGVIWAILRPLLTMAVFTVIFGRLAKLPSDGGAPYALLVFAGLLPWTLFATSLSDASNSLIGNANLISKVYFPRLIVPAATIVTAFADFLISLVLLLALMVYYRFAPSWNMLLLPGFIAAGPAGQSGAGSLDHGAERQVPRFSACDSFCRAVRPVCVACGVQQQRHPGAVAIALQPESDGRRH